ncbi:MAG TPA: RagB/SusD family nutrient uptake outer membrane protein [Sphingobacterium sp.]|nr:RagB/SusD family nutrient uptake outer membrane protein [Sphingobacterium sp.]
MKKIFYFNLLILVYMLNGCSGFLDIKPLSFTTPSNFYKDAGDLEIALTGCYGQFGASYAVNYRTGMFFIGNVGTDELVGNPYATPDATSNMDQFINGRIVKSNRNIRDIWEKMYGSIYAINDLLHNLEKVDMDADRKAAIRAEALFLRGWHYMHLGMIFGGVPVYIAVPHAMDQGRDKLEDVMKQAISDLQYAYEHLEASGTVDVTRANKWAAAGYLSRLYCYLASAKKYETGKNLSFALNSFDWVDVNQYYDQALTLIQIIETSSPFKLTADYRHLFIEGSVSKQKEEVLFALAPSPEKKIGFGLMYYLLPVGNQGGGWGTCRPTQEVLNRYNRNMDMRGHWVVGGLADTDVGTEVIDGNTYNRIKDLTLNSNGEAYDGDYSVTKFRYLRTASKHDDIYYGYFPLLRYAEIVLLKAEAIAHRQGDDQGRTVLKELRERALVKNSGYQTDNLQTLYARTDFVTELLEERSRELCFEHYRKFDLIRFNRYESTIKALSTTFGVWNRNAAQQLINNISDGYIWCPIPEEDEIANPNLKPNNPGY